MRSKKSKSRLPKVVGAYVRLASAATTDNQFRAIVRSIENRLCPREWAEIVDFVQTKADLTARSRSGLREFFSRNIDPADSTPNNALELQLILESESEPNYRKTDDVAAFKRVLNLRGVSHFIHPRNKTHSVLVVWTGIAGRPMMPLRHFLQAVWQCDVDVLVLRARPTKSDYAEGVPFFGDALDATIDGLREYSARCGYTTVHVTGMSMGTPPALLSAPRLCAQNCLLTGPIDPRHNYDTEFQRFAREMEDAHESTRFVTFVGELALEDRAAARYVSSVVKNVEMYSPGTNHNPLWPLQQRGELADWLRLNLFQNVVS